MAGTDPDEDFIEISMRMTMQEFTAWSRHSLAPRLRAAVFGADAAPNGDERVVASIDSGCFGSIEQACADENIELSVTKMDLVNDKIIFSFDRRRLAAVSEIVDRLAASKLAGPLTLVEDPGADADFTKLAARLQPKGIEMTATQNDDMVVVQARSATWEDLETGLADECTNSGDALPELRRMSCSPDTLELLKEAAASESIPLYLPQTEDRSAIQFLSCDQAALSAMLSRIGANERNAERVREEARSLSDEVSQPSAVREGNRVDEAVSRGRRAAEAKESETVRTVRGRHKSPELVR